MTLDKQRATEAAGDYRSACVQPDSYLADEASLDASHVSAPTDKKVPLVVNPPNSSNIYRDNVFTAVKS